MLQLFLLLGLAFLPLILQKKTPKQIKEKPTKPNTKPNHNNNKKKNQICCLPFLWPKWDRSHPKKNWWRLVCATKGQCSDDMRWIWGTSSIVSKKNVGIRILVFPMWPSQKYQGLIPFVLGSGKQCNNSIQTLIKKDYICGRWKICGTNSMIRISELLDIIIFDWKYTHQSWEALAGRHYKGSLTRSKESLCGSLLRLHTGIKNRGLDFYNEFLFLYITVGRLKGLKILIFVVELRSKF